MLNLVKLKSDIVININNITFNGGLLDSPNNKLSSIEYLNLLKKKEIEQAQTKVINTNDNEVVNDKGSLLKMFESFLDNHFGAIKDGSQEQSAQDESLINKHEKDSKSNSFSSDLNLFKAVNHEEQITLEVVYEPYKPDAHGEWMSEETILKACENFNYNLQKGIVQPNLFHLQNAPDQIQILKTYVIEEEMTFGTEDNPITVSEGTWVAEIKYLDKTLWELRKAGVVGGLSIGAKGIVHKPRAEVNQDNKE